MLSSPFSLRSGRRSVAASHQPAGIADHTRGRPVPSRPCVVAGQPPSSWPARALSPWTARAASWGWRRDRTSPSTSSPRVARSSPSTQAPESALSPLFPHTEPVVSAREDDGGHYLATVTFTGQPLLPPFSACAAAAFVPDARLATMSSTGELRLRDFIPNAEPVAAMKRRVRLLFPRQGGSWPWGT